MVGYITVHNSLNLTTGSAGSYETSDGDSDYIGEFTDELRNEDGGHELMLDTGESRIEGDDHHYALTSAAEEFRMNEDDYDEYRNEDDGHELMLASEESRIEGDHELTLAEQMTNEGDGSFGDENSVTDSELDCSQRNSDINASDSECEDAGSHSNTGLHSNREDSDNWEELHKLDDDPLYPGASITVKVIMILILVFATRHKLTNEAISDY